MDVLYSRTVLAVLDDDMVLKLVNRKSKEEKLEVCIFGGHK